MLVDSADANAQQSTSRRAYCLSPFQVQRNIRAALRTPRTDILSVLQDCEEKYQLYMAHQLRAFLKNRRIWRLYEVVEDSPPRTSAVILMYYKIKFEEMHFFETTAQFFGKKSIGWHGSVLFYSEF